MAHFFEGELNELRAKLVLMGERAIELVRSGIESLESEEPILARQVIKMDDAIDELEKQIDSAAIRYISLRAPVASDLRLLTVAMKACHDLERVGDEASSIAKRALRLMDMGPVGDLSKIISMSTLVVSQLRDALDSFIDEDRAKAFVVPKRDRDVDDLNRENFANLARIVRADPEGVERAFELIFISKSLERIGDHATNIAEDVIFLLEGDDVRHTHVTRRAASQAPFGTNRSE